MILDFTESAAGDLRAIGEFTRSHWGEEQEERYLRNLYQKFRGIAADPVRWKFREDLFPRCQIAREGRHVILFRLDREVLLIVRILHGAMDFTRHIPEDFG